MPPPLISPNILLLELLHKFVMAHKIQASIGICSIVAVVIAVKIFIWIKERNKMVKASVKVEENDD